MCDTVTRSLPVGIAFETAKSGCFCVPEQGLVKDRERAWEAQTSACVHWSHLQVGPEPNGTYMFQDWAPVPDRKVKVGNKKTEQAGHDFLLRQRLTVNPAKLQLKAPHLCGPFQGSGGSDQCVWVGLCFCSIC